MFEYSEYLLLGTLCLCNGGEANGDNDDVAKVGIEQVRRNNVTGRVFVKFEKVWEAVGCEIVLNETELFESVISVARVLEKDLPEVLKKKEAEKRDKAKAKKAKAKKAKEAED